MCADNDGSDAEDDDAWSERCDRRATAVKETLTWDEMRRDEKRRDVAVAARFEEWESRRRAGRLLYNFPALGNPCPSREIGRKPPFFSRPLHRRLAPSRPPFSPRFSWRLPSPSRVPPSPTHRPQQRGALLASASLHPHLFKTPSPSLHTPSLSLSLHTPSPSPISSIRHLHLSMPIPMSFFIYVSISISSKQVWAMNTKTHVSSHYKRLCNQVGIIHYLCPFQFKNVPEDWWACAFYTR